MLDESLGLWGLFVSAFISSTIAPGGSEALLAYMVNKQLFDTFRLVSVATVGNTLGALTTWGLGMLAATKVSADNVFQGSKQKSLGLVRRWGIWILLFSWLPVLGDGFCFAGGWLKLPFFLSVLLIFVGKAIRYIAVAMVFS